MKKSTIERIEEEINQKTKLPNEVKEKIKKEVFTNIVIGSITILYLIFIILGSKGSTKNVRTTDLNIFCMLFLGIAIYLFEIAYRKDNGKLAMYGIESLIIAIFTLFLPYIIFELNEKNKNYYLTAAIFVSLYYILKSLIISIKTKNKHMNSNISDIKEIVKKEKTKGRIKEEIEEIEVKDKNNKKNVGVALQGDPQQKQTDEIIQKQETKPKKRGRPKKTETKNNENKSKEENAPKKRGRPRKVAVNND